MSGVFLDTAGLIAVVDVADQWHAVAEKVWREMLASTDPIVLSSPKIGRLKTFFPWIITSSKPGSGYC